MPPPQRANTLRGVAGEPDELNRLISGHSRKDLAAILGVRKAAGDDAADGGADEFLVRWVDGTSGDWVPEAWLEPSPASWGKVLEFRDHELSRLQAESATTIQATWRRFLQIARNQRVLEAAIKAQAMHRSRLVRRHLLEVKLQLEAQRIEKSAQAAARLRQLQMEKDAERKREEAEKLKAEQMRQVREQAESLMAQQGGEKVKIDPDAPLRAPEPPSHLRPVRMPGSPRSRSARGSARGAKMGYTDYMAALDLQLHRERIKAIRPATDVSAPPEFEHLKQKLKQKQMMLEKEMQIERENALLERRVAEMPTLSFGSQPAFNSTGDLGMNSTQAFARKMQKMEHHQHRQRVACVTTAILVVAVFFPGHSRQLTRQGFWRTGG